MILLVGERYNRARFKSEHRWTPERWARTVDRLPAFPPSSDSGLRSTAKLLSLGLRWDSSVNLTPPAPQGEAFDADFAARVATELGRQSRPGDVFLLCGRRAQRAFGMTGAWPHGGSTRDTGRVLVSLPHPSGLCRFWNDDCAVEACRELCTSALRDAMMGGP